MSQSSLFTGATGIDTMVESFIWHYDDATGKLTPQWINSSGSLPHVFYGYHTPAQVVIATGDRSVFEANFGPGDVQWLDLYYVVAAEAP